MTLPASQQTPWSAARREAYANDQDAAASLVAVTTRTNRQNADQDPATWMPPQPVAQCRYIGEWITTKLRCSLTADQNEADMLKVYSGGPCELEVVQYTPAAEQPGWKNGNTAPAPRVRGKRAASNGQLAPPTITDHSGRVADRIRVRADQALTGYESHRD